MFRSGLHLSKAHLDLGSKEYELTHCPRIGPISQITPLLRSSWTSLSRTWEALPEMVWRSIFQPFGKGISCPRWTYTHPWKYQVSLSVPIFSQLSPMCENLPPIFLLDLETKVSGWRPVADTYSTTEFSGKLTSPLVSCGLWSMSAISTSFTILRSNKRWKQQIWSNRGLTWFMRLHVLVFLLFVLEVVPCQLCSGLSFGFLSHALRSSSCQLFA